MRLARTKKCFLRHFALVYTLFLLFLLTISSCSQKDPAIDFSGTLSKIDVLITSGKTNKALGQLTKLQRKATSARQWLSIIKRQIHLDRSDLALHAVTEALARQPANEDLSAIKAWLLSEKGLSDDAVSFFSVLRNSPYTAITALIGVNQALSSSLSAQENEWWESAWDSIKYPQFLRNAAVASALEGDFHTAYRYATKVYEAAPTEQHVLDAARIAIDGNMTDSAIYLLSSVYPSTKSDSILLLLADAWILTDNIVNARNVWATLISRGKPSSPLPLYNYAFSDPDVVYRKETLERCLAWFPGYYPAVAVYVRSVPGSGSGVHFDQLEKELDEAGFSTLQMEEKKRTAPVSADDATRCLSIARSNAAGEDLIRIELEALRFLEIIRDNSSLAGPELWKLLEKYPNSNELKEYAISYFARNKEFETAFSLNRDSGTIISPLFEGIRLAALGDLDEAVSCFNIYAGDIRSEWMALANLGLVAEKKHEYATAIEKFSLAAEKAPNERNASRLHFETARILANVKNPDRAISVLGYALQLDPANHRAEQLKRQLEAVK